MKLVIQFDKLGKKEIFGVWENGLVRGLTLSEWMVYSAIPAEERTVPLVHSNDLTEYNQCMQYDMALRSKAID